MTTYFVTRHRGARDWAEAQGIAARFVPHLEAEQIASGDIVMGTLPIPLVAQICATGVRYFHLVLDLPPDWRGRELTAQDMARFGARLEEYTAARATS